MAVRKGKKAALVFDRGPLVPMHRTLGSRNKAVVFELPEAMSSVRTIARTIDLSAKVVRSLQVAVDLRTAVTGQAYVGADTRLLVVRPFNVDLGFALVIKRPIDIVPDISTAIFKMTARSFDCAMVVSRPVISDFDVRQRIYVYLFRESHEIQV